MEFDIDADIPVGPPSRYLDIPGYKDAFHSHFGVQGRARVKQSRVRNRLVVFHNVVCDSLQERKVMAPDRNFLRADGIPLSNPAAQGRYPFSKQALPLPHPV
jgi:hypothetical protein